MKRRWSSLVIAATLMMTGTAHSYTNGNLNIDVGTGWRQDRLNYDSFYPTYSVLVGSSLSAPVTAETAVDYAQSVDYNDIRSWVVGGKAEYKYCGVFARLFGQYGGIYSGHSSVSSINATSVAFNHIYNAESDRGEVFDFGVALGVPFCFNLCNLNITFAPIGGWSQSEQHLRQQKQQIISDPVFNILGPTVLPLLEFGVNIPHIYNSYQTRWNGWFAGYDLAIDVPCTDLVLYTGFEWHWPRLLTRGQYNADATTILNPSTVPPSVAFTYLEEKVDFTQKDWGNGFVVRLGGEWFLNHCWSVGILGSYSKFWADGGYQDATIELPAAFPAASKSIGTLSNINWTSWSVLGTIGYQF